jgi:hypothetical protein
MVRGSSRARAAAASTDSPVPLAGQDLEIARLARCQPEATGRSTIAGGRTLLRVALYRDDFAYPGHGNLFRLKLRLARKLRRKLRLATIEIDDCVRPDQAEESYALQLDPPDPASLAELHATVRKVLTSATGRALRGTA